MNDEQKQLIREKWQEKSKDICVGFSSDGYGDEVNIYIDEIGSDEITDFWLNELDLATKETERVTEERIESMITDADAPYTTECCRKTANHYKDQITTLIRNK